MSVFGKAKFGGNKRTWFKLKDGDSVYRILPPMGDQQKDGRWSAFYGIHYGYKNSKGEMRTFQSPLIKNRKTKMVEVPDAALERIAQLKAKLEDAKEAGNKELVVNLLKLVGGQKSRYNLDNNHYMNVVDLQGNVGILKIRHKCKLALDTQIKKLRDAGVEPLDPESGRYFTFTRSGMGMDTVYQVSVYKKKIKVEGLGEVEQDLVHTITDELANRCLVENSGPGPRFTYKEAANLATLFKKPTAEEVARIVAEGEKAVDEILDAKTANDTGVTQEAEDDSGTEDDEALAPAAAAPTTTATTTAPPATTTTTAAAPPVTETVAPAAKVTETKAAPASAPKTTAEAVGEQTDEDFLKSLGL